MNPLATGIVNHITKVKKKVNTGANKKIGRFAFVGRINSLVTSFKPSANGCNNPKKPTVFGPRLRCILLNTFLSTNVKIAIEPNIGIICTTNSTKLAGKKNNKLLGIENICVVFLNTTN